MDPRILLVNGPPRSGKDTVGALLEGMLRKVCYSVKFARALKEMTHRAHGLGGFRGEYFDAVKDQPHEAFRGATPRACYIQMSEGYMKPLYGQDVFGHILADWIEDLEVAWEDGEPHLYVITDSGFAPEAQVLIDRFGQQNVGLLRITRQGCDFSGDSRGWVDLEDQVPVFSISNDASMADLATRLRILMELSPIFEPFYGYLKEAQDPSLRLQRLSDYPPDLPRPGQPADWRLPEGG